MSVEAAATASGDDNGKNDDQRMEMVGSLEATLAPHYWKRPSCRILEEAAEEDLLHGHDELEQRVGGPEDIRVHCSAAVEDHAEEQEDDGHQLDSVIHVRRTWNSTRCRPLVCPLADVHKQGGDDGPRCMHNGGMAAYAENNEDDNSTDCVRGMLPEATSEDRQDGDDAGVDRRHEEEWEGHADDSRTENGRESHDGREQPQAVDHYLATSRHLVLDDDHFPVRRYASDFAE